MKGRRGDVSATTTFAAQRDAAQETWAAPQHFRTSQQNPASSTHNPTPLYSYFLLRSMHVCSRQHSIQTSTEKNIDLRHRCSPHLSWESWVGLKDSDATELESTGRRLDLRRVQLCRYKQAFTATSGEVKVHKSLTDKPPTLRHRQ